MGNLSFSELFHTRPYESQNQTEAALRVSFTNFLDKLKPPFSPRILIPKEYEELNKAILYGILTQPHLSKTHFTHLCAVVTDGYQLFVEMLLKMVNKSYQLILQPVKVQLMWVCGRLIGAEGIGIEELIVSLLRQIVGGDYSSENLWLASEVIMVLRRNMEWVLVHEFLVGASLYTFLRLLSDHYRLENQLASTLKQQEVEFCIMLLREHFGLCLSIGRDLIRLLQDVAYIPEFQILWKDLLSNPSIFGDLRFTDISYIYKLKTPEKYFSLRLTAEMETKLNFLLMNVKWGNQKRYQQWFRSKYLCSPEMETLVPDLVRFICCTTHPSDEIVHNVISRWAVVGWLLKCCIHKHHYEACSKLALFYDWLFFDEMVDNVMNLEPAMLLMVNSIPQYAEITNTLLEFLFLVMDNYDVYRKETIIHNVYNSFSTLCKKGIADVSKLICCPFLLPLLRERLKSFSEPPMLFANKISPRKSQAIEVLRNSSFKHDNGVRNRKMVEIIGMLKDLGESFVHSKEQGLQLMEKMLSAWMNLKEATQGVELEPETFADMITQSLRSKGYEIFLPLKCVSNNVDEDLVGSPTAIILRAFMLSKCEKLQKLLWSLSKSGLPVGPHLLSYASRLDCEAQTRRILFSLPATSALNNGFQTDRDLSNHSQPNSVFGNGTQRNGGFSNDNHLSDGIGNCNQENGRLAGISNNKHITDKDTSKVLLNWHVNGRKTFAREIGSTTSVMSLCEQDDKMIVALVHDAFSVYRSFLTLLGRQKLNEVRTDANSEVSILPRTNEINEPCASLISDMTTCFRWQESCISVIVCSIFRQLPELTTCRADVIRRLVSLISHAHFVHIQFRLGLRDFSMFGKDAKAICALVKISLEWNSLEQQKFWCLLTSELLVSDGEVPKMLLEFSSGAVDPRRHSEAIFGIYTLMRSQTPKLDLINAVLLLPSTFREFSVAVLASWTVLNSYAFFSILKEWISNTLSVIDSNIQNTITSKSGLYKLNATVILDFVCFLKKLHLDTGILKKTMPHIISDIQQKLLTLVKHLETIPSFQNQGTP